MIVLSWDIGISNLSWCLMTYYSDKNTYDIFDWNVINFMDPSDNKRIINCKGIVASGKRKGLVCGKSAFYVNENDCSFCKQHNPKKENYKKEKKENCKKKRKKNIPLHDLAHSLTKTLDNINLLENKCVDVILIESQPKIASASVKHVMDFLLCYLTIRSIDKNLTTKPKIITISAKHKLNLYDGPLINCSIKDAHSRNKFLGIAHCRYILESSLTNEEEEEPFYSVPDWISFFETIKKKDDLADSFLQGAWYLKINGA